MSVKEPIVFFMGCTDQFWLGHHLVISDGMRRNVSLIPKSIDSSGAGDDLDNCDRWAGGSLGEQHIPVLHHIDNWTVLGMRDYTRDRHPGSGITFCTEGTHSLENMIIITRNAFPEVWKRIDNKR